MARKGEGSSLHRRHPSTSATGAASSETGRFPVVSAPFPSATLYRKHRAPLTAARGVPFLAGGGGRLPRCSGGKHYRAVTLQAALLPAPPS